MWNRDQILYPLFIYNVYFTLLIHYICYVKFCILQAYDRVINNKDPRSYMIAAVVVIIIGIVAGISFSVYYVKTHED